MPIYEYYCPACHGQFSHLARQIDAAPPACPRCGNEDVERLVSAASVIHNQKHHEQQLRSAAQHVDAEDARAIADFLQESGRLEDAEGLFGSKAYRELVARRAEGATDADLSDLVDELETEMRESDASRMTGAVLFSDRVENRMEAEGPPDEEEADAASQPSRSRKSADKLGWA